MSTKTAKWGMVQQGHNIAVRLGNVTARAQALVVKRRVQGIRNLIQAHSKTATSAARQQKELLKHLDEVEAALQTAAKGVDNG